MKLIHNGRKTNAYYKLLEACGKEGVAVKRRARGYSDYDICNSLIAQGFVVWRGTGPRGGSRLHATESGREAIELIENQGN